MARHLPIRQMASAEKSSNTTLLRYGFRRNPFEKVRDDFFRKNSVTHHKQANGCEKADCPA